jgi:hypothetical protein
MRQTVQRRVRRRKDEYVVRGGGVGHVGGSGADTASTKSSEEGSTVVLLGDGHLGRESGERVGGLFSGRGSRAGEGWLDAREERAVESCDAGQGTGDDGVEDIPGERGHKVDRRPVGVWYALNRGCLEPNSSHSACSSSSLVICVATVAQAVDIYHGLDPLTFEGLTWANKHADGIRRPCSHSNFQICRRPNQPPCKHVCIFPSS